VPAKPPPHLPHCQEVVMLSMVCGNLFSDFLICILTLLVCGGFLEENEKSLQEKNFYARESSKLFKPRKVKRRVKKFSLVLSDTNLQGVDLIYVFPSNITLPLHIEFTQRLRRCSLFWFVVEGEGGPGELVSCSRSVFHGCSCHFQKEK